MQHHDLPIHLDTGTDADHWDVQRLAYDTGE